MVARCGEPVQERRRPVVERAFASLGEPPLPLAGEVPALLVDHAVRWAALDGLAWANRAAGTNAAADTVPESATIDPALLPCLEPIPVRTPGQRDAHLAELVERAKALDRIAQTHIAKLSGPRRGGK